MQRPTAPNGMSTPCCGSGNGNGARKSASACRPSWRSAAP
jgi:hypothetical protein